MPHAARFGSHASEGMVVISVRDEVARLIEAVIFDMDGLLVDTNPVWDSARAWMAEQAGRSWGPEDNRAVMGASTQEWADYMIDRLELTLSRDEVAAAIVGRMV